MMGIYRITNIDNGRVYIGASENIDQRLRTHKGKLTRGSHSNKLLQADFTLYGPDKFTFCAIAEVFVREELPEKEQHYMDEYRSYHPQYGYNQSAKSGLSAEKPTRSDTEIIRTRQKLAEFEYLSRRVDRLMTMIAEGENKLKKVIAEKRELKKLLRFVKCTNENGQTYRLLDMIEDERYWARNDGLIEGYRLAVKEHGIALERNEEPESEAANRGRVTA